MVRRVLFLAVVLLLLDACADAGATVDLLPYAPTPQHPVVACIAQANLLRGDGPAYREADKHLRAARGQRVLLPEIVRIIGITSFEDGERWKVLRAGVFDVEQWQPWPKEKVQIRDCGPEADAYRAAQDGGQRE